MADTLNALDRNKEARQVFEEGLGFLQRVEIVKLDNGKNSYRKLKHAFGERFSGPLDEEVDLDEELSAPEMEVETEIVLPADDRETRLLEREMQGILKRHEGIEITKRTGMVTAAVELLQTVAAGRHSKPPPIGKEATRKSANTPSNTTVQDENAQGSLLKYATLKTPSKRLL